MRNAKNLVILLLPLFFFLPCSAATIIVEANGFGDYPTIQDAIDVAEDGNVVEIRPGTYTGIGNHDIDFLGKAITVRSIDPNDPNIVESTIIDCNGAGRGFRFDSGEWDGSVVAGLTITNGYASEGGGIYIVECKPWIINCTICNSQATSSGGGIYIKDAIPIIISCTISDNTSTFGGGISNEGNLGGEFSDCQINNNNALLSGGGINDTATVLKLSNCEICDNSCTDLGGGIYKSRGYLGATHCLIRNNVAMVGGGIYCESELNLENCILSCNRADFAAAIRSDSRTKLVHCTVSSNYALIEHGGIVCEEGIEFTDCIFWGNTDVSGDKKQIEWPFWECDIVQYCCIQDEDPYDSNVPFEELSNTNIDDHPMFVRDPNPGSDGLWDGVDDDYGDLHLQPNSPCINRGDPNYVVAWAGVDIDGQPRVFNGRIDMGVDEYVMVITEIVVTKPQEGEVWAAGSNRTIEWRSYGIEGAVDISYSDSNGTSWKSIENDVCDTSSYLWQIPKNVDSNQCLISVVPSVDDGNSICVESSLFTINGWHHPRRVPWGLKKKWMQQDYIHSGPEVGCVKWKFETEGPVSAKVAIQQDNKVHIASEDGKVYTVDSDGNFLWSYDTNSVLIGSPAAGHYGLVYAAGENGWLYAFNKNGDLVWNYCCDSLVYSSPAVSSDEQVYICSMDGVVHALGIDGSELWNFETDGFGVLDGAIFATPKIDEDGTIYVTGLYDPNLYALEPNGSVKWAYPVGQGYRPYYWADGATEDAWGLSYTPPAIAEDGTFYQTLLYDVNLYAMDSNGSLLWGTHLSDTDSGWFEAYYNLADMKHEKPWYRVGISGLSEPVVGPDGMVYVSYDDPYLRAVEPNGAIKWVTRLGMLSASSHLAVEKDGLIYAASDGLYVVEPGGEEVSRFEGDDWLSYPVIIKGNTVIVSDRAGAVWAISDENCQGRGHELHRPADIDGSRIVEFVDFAKLAADWLDCTDQYRFESEISRMWGPSWKIPCDYMREEIYEGEEIYLEGDVNRDLYVNTEDLVLIVNKWLEAD